MRDIVTHLKVDGDWFTTTMVDYYGLPQEGDRGWPGRKAAAALRFEDRAASVENAVSDEIRQQVGSSANRFVPFVVMHEFEALLFSDCGRFAHAVGAPALGPQLQSVRDEFTTPEEINDDPVTAPSKRVQQLLPGYQKVLLGPLAAQEIGLEAISRECPHFRSWLDRLEGLVES